MPDEDRQLRANSIDLVEVLFQAITYMAPATGLAFSLGIAVPITGTTLPLSVLVAMVACSFCAIALGQLATRIPSAGGIYAYAARGLGPRMGFITGWLYGGGGLLLPGSNSLLGGWFVNGFLSRQLGLSLGWATWTLFFAVCVGLLAYFDVRMSAKATIVLGVLEIAIFLALGLWMVATGDNSLAPFSPAAGKAGWSGICQGAVFAVLAFVGFEAATALGEEARNPRRTVPWAVVGSCLLVGLYYFFLTYAWNIGAKLDIIGHNRRSNNSDWDLFGAEYWGNAGAWLLFCALFNSIVACGTAATNNASRVLFAMARAGSAPRFLNHVHPRYRSPHRAVVACVLVATTVALLLAQYFGAALGPGSEGLVGFVVIATFLTVLAIVIYMISCLACIRFFASERRSERHFFWHVGAPALGIAGFVLPLYTQYFNLAELFAGHWFVWAYKDAEGANLWLTSAVPATWSIMGALVWIAAGVAFAWYLHATRPERLMIATRAFGGELDEPIPP